MKHSNPKTTTPATKRALSPALRLTLGLATLVTLAFAAFSAYALHSEPTMRAEDSSYESRSIAVQVRKSESAAAELRKTEAAAATRTVALRTDRGATDAADYLPRARALDRSL